MSNVLLVSTAKVKQLTTIQQNVEDSLIIPYIKKSQDTHIQETLGTDLYEKILSDVNDGFISGVYKDLLDKYIVPCLVEWAFYEVLPYINFKMTNKSIVQGNSEFSSEVDLEELKYLRSVSRDMADFYTARLVGFLKEYQHLFPEYLTNTGFDKIKPLKRQNFFGGIYTGEGRRGDDSLGADYIDLN